MSDFGSALEKARKAFATVSKLEAAAASAPNNRALQANLLTGRRLAEKLQSSVFELAAAEQVDVCRYRLVSDFQDGRFNLTDVARSLDKFQQLFTSIYDAIIGKPKRRARIAHAVERESAFQFGYSYAGSLGIVLVVPSGRDLFFGKFDSAVSVFHQLFEIENASDVVSLAEHFGFSVVRRAYDWSLENYSDNFSVDIQWKNSDGVQRGEILRREKLGRVVDIFSRTSETTLDDLYTVGRLFGINVQTGRFDFVGPNGARYTGGLGTGFAKTKDYTVGSVVYRAHILALRVFRYATEAEEMTYTLQSLEADLSA